MIMHIFNKMGDCCKDWDDQCILWQYIGYLVQKEEKVLYLMLW